MHKNSWALFLFLLLAQTNFAQKVAPNAMPDNFSWGFNFTKTVAPENGVLANDTDSNVGTVLTVNPTPVADVSSGALSLNTDGSFTYTPNTNFFGTDSFTYQVCDDGTPTEIVSQFDFDTPVLTTATIGPDATSINPDAVAIECGLHIPQGSSGGGVGLDIVVPNTGGIFNFSSFMVSFEYRDQESFGTLIEAGNFRLFHIGPNNLGMEITVINGDTGLQQTYTLTLGPFLAGNTPYTVAYNEVTGEITYNANGAVTVFSVAPLFSPLDVSLASDIIIGGGLDNAGRNFASFCSVSFEDQSALCDTAVVTLNIKGTVVTNRRITYRVKPN